MKAGDVVECIDKGQLKLLSCGTRYTVKEVFMNRDTEFCVLKEVIFTNSKRKKGFYTTRFKIVGYKTPTLKEAIAEGVADIKERLWQKY